MDRDSGGLGIRTERRGEERRGEKRLERVTQINERKKRWGQEERERGNKGR